MGNPKCVEGEGVIIGFDGCEGSTLAHKTQEEMSCLMSFDIPGQKYSAFANMVVLVMPEWLACSRRSTGLTANRGSTIRRAVSYTHLTLPTTPYV